MGFLGYTQGVSAGHQLRKWAIPRRCGFIPKGQALELTWTAAVLVMRDGLNWMWEY